MNNYYIYINLLFLHYSLIASLSVVGFDNPMHTSGDMPDTASLDIQYASGPCSEKFSSTAAWTQGFRDHNEDSFGCVQTDNYCIAVVCDGHCGPEASPLAMNYFLQRTTDLFERNDKVSHNSFSEVVRECEIALYSLLYSPGCYTSGTTLTAVVLSYKDDRLWFVNLGDSRTAAYTKDSNVFFETIDHTADNQSEHERIINLNGTILPNGRIKVGRSWLMPSRTLGDFSLKTSLFDDSKNIISYEPDITSFSLKDVSTIILASDGVWCDVHTLTADEAIDTVNAANECPALDLVQCVLKKGSTDNCTALVLRQNK